MSIHAMIAAAYLEDLAPAAKLVLMAVADSCDEQTREAAPGLPKIRAWSGLKRSQALAQVRALTMTDGPRPRYLEHVAAGRIGRRAVYRVFPDGVPTIPHPDEVTARFELPTAGGKTVDNPSQEGPADWTLDYEEGPVSAIEGPAQTGPLHASFQSSSARATTTARTATPSRSGFPGARTTAIDEDAAGIARRAKGAADTPCPFHPEHIVPCGRCAHRAANSDPAAIRAAQLAARQGIALARHNPEETDQP